MHRGPDAAGEWWSSDGHIGFAHRRLSIIDLSVEAHQPMFDVSRQLQIIFNGEIYNHHELRSELSAHGDLFRTQSDTEVILAAYQRWGAECMAHLNGMFAFALYDSKTRRVMLARDRAGEKPLFYHYSSNVLRFSSELKGLLSDIELDRQIDLQALDCYLAYGYVPGDRCILRGFNKLPPGHAAYFSIDSGEFKVWQYWQPPELQQEKSYHEEDLLNELENLLADAVNRQLVADVPVGVLLSGGLDSSLITSMAARSGKQLKTFTVRLPGHGKLDETQHARLIAKFFNTEHIELEISNIRPDLITHLARQFDEPLVDSSMIPTFLVTQLVRKYCKVVLGGDGGDELFGGYEHYSRLLFMQNQLGRFPLTLRKIIAKSTSSLLPVGFKGRNWLLGLGEDLERGLPMVASYFDNPTCRHRLSKNMTERSFSAKTWMQARIPLQNDLMQRAMRMDYANYLAEDILVKVDRASMLNSLEVRAPFLDYRLIEFAFSRVPTSLKVSAQNKKILLKRLAAKILPAEFDLQRKQGFSIPLGTWLKTNDFSQFFNEVLLSSDCMFDQKLVRQLIKNQERGYANSERLFALILMELWRHEYKVRL